MCWVKVTGSMGRRYVDCRLQWLEYIERESPSVSWCLGVECGCTLFAVSRASFVPTEILDLCAGVGRSEVVFVVGTI